MSEQETITGREFLVELTKDTSGGVIPRLRARITRLHEELARLDPDSLAEDERWPPGWYVSDWREVSVLRERARELEADLAWSRVSSPPPSGPRTP